MPEVYVLTASVLLIALVLWHRDFLVKRLQKIAFRQKIAARVDELKQQEQDPAETRFKAHFMESRRQSKGDYGRYKDAMRKGEMAMTRGEWESAKAWLIQALAHQPDDPEAGRQLAGVYSETGDIRRAENLYRRLAELDPGQADVHSELAHIYARRKKYKEAIAHLVRAVELNEKNDQWLMRLGQLYSLLMRPGLAAECFRRAAELKPRDVEYLFMLGESCLQDEDFDNALFTYTKILSIEPYNEKAQARSQEVRVKMKEAEAMFSQIAGSVRLRRAAT